MSLNQNSKPSNGDGRVFYNGREILHFVDIAGKKFSAKRHLRILENYERLVANEKYNKARRIEAERMLPVTWLNFVVSGLIEGFVNRGEYTDARKLIREFKDRGYTESWLGRGRYKNTQGEI